MKTFQDFILNEISNKQLEKVTDKIERYNDQQFDDFDEIFGNKLRIVIPLQTSTNHYDISNSLKKLGYETDLQQGIAKSTVQTQHGPKVRSERLGSLLTKLHKKDLKGGWDKWLDWWQKKGNKTDATSPMSIIISRSPIDVIRMSDHREIYSCHSPPGSSNTRGWKNGPWHYCARQEALTGGVMAYAVKTEDLQDIPDLQAPEIFKDRDRDIEGIQPLERVRLRKFSDGETNVLIPETRTYGINHTGFLESVVNWARHVQNNIVNNPPNFHDFDLYGGSYQDNSAGALWSNFFKVNVTGNKKSVNAKDEDSTDIDENEVRRIIDAHNLIHAYIYTDVEGMDEGELYLDVLPGVSFVFQENLFISIPTYQDLNRWGGKDRATTLGRDLANQLFYFENLEVNEYQGKVIFNVDFESQAFTGNEVLHNLEAELDRLDDIEKEYSQHYTNFFRLLQEHGFIESEKPSLQHFQSSDDGEYVSELMWIGDASSFMKDPEPSTYGIGRKLFDFPNEISQQAITIFPFPEIVKPGNVTFECDTNQLRGFNKLYLKLSIEPNFQSYDKFMKVLKHIDQYWDYYTQRAVKWFETVKNQYDKYKTIPAIKMPLKIPKSQPDTRQTMMNFKDWINI